MSDKTYEIIRESEVLVLVCRPMSTWIAELVNNNEPIPIKRERKSTAVFTFETGDVLKKIPTQTDDDEFGDDDISASECYVWHFKLGDVDEEGYYVIPKRILSSDHDMLIHNSVNVTMEFFAGAVVNTRIVNIIDKMIGRELIIGGKRDDAIPQNEYLALIMKFPSRDELHIYARSRVEGLLCEYYPQTEESSRILQEYIERRYKRADRVYGRLMAQRNVDSALSAIREIDCAKMRFALNRMEELLAGCEKYTEIIWQREIEKIILLVFPQYVAKISHLQMPDSIGYAHHREIDIALVSMTGCVDIVEIKRPEEWQLLSQKSIYRDNYIPSRKLSCAVMQAEKYLVNLEKWGCEGEKEIARKCGIREIRIRHPKVILIAGRDSELDCDQKKSDFEIIKRKYASVLDIVTYDNLTNRLKNAILQLHSVLKRGGTK